MGRRHHPVRAEEGAAAPHLPGAVQYSAVQYSTVPYSSVQYITVQYSTGRTCLEPVVTSPACQGHSPTPASAPPTILVSRTARPHRQPPSSSTPGPGAAEVSACSRRPARAQALDGVFSSIYLLELSKNVHTLLIAHLS